MRQQTQPDELIKRERFYLQWDFKSRIRVNIEKRRKAWQRCLWFRQHESDREFPRPVSLECDADFDRLAKLADEYGWHVLLSDELIALARHFRDRSNSTATRKRSAPSFGLFS